MGMPEASMNEHDRAVLWKHEVRLPGKVLAVKAKPETKTMQCGPDCQFRFRILAPDPCHHPTPHIRRYSVGGHSNLLRLRGK